MESRPLCRWMRIATLAGLAVACSGLDAPGYRFYLRTDDVVVAVADGAKRWSRSVWGPGEMLTWAVTNDPRWTSEWTDSNGASRQAPLNDPEEVIPFAARALAAWSEIEGADIRWEVSGVDASLEDAEEGDGRPTIFVDPEAERGSYAWSQSDSTGGVWRTVDCDVPLAPFAAADLHENIWWTFVLIHEFGHCLGLAHSGTFPRLFEGRQLDLRGAFGIDPLMSYGNYYGDLLTLSPDDRLGASLLRPAPGWEASTGAVAGVVTVGEDPAPFVQVFAVPVSGGIAGGAVGSFTNEDGEFVLEGLEPGRYVLWTGPLNTLYAHWWLLAQAPPPVLDATEQALLLPVTVTRGAITDGIQIDTRATRKP